MLSRRKLREHVREEVYFWRWNGEKEAVGDEIHSLLYIYI